MHLQQHIAHAKPYRCSLFVVSNGMSVRMWYVYFGVRACHFCNRVGSVPTGGDGHRVNSQSGKQTCSNSIDRRFRRPAIFRVFQALEP